MHEQVIPNSKNFYGRVRAHRVLPADRWVAQTEWKNNTIVYEWGAIVGRLLMAGDRKYRISGMYLEFENVAMSGDAVTIPTYGRTRNIDYYNELSGSGSRDYLRVPVTSSVLNVSDEDLFPHGNEPVFFSRSQGLVGVHGKPFSHVNNSVVYGASLVAMVNATDATQDLILSTFYFAEESQQPKLSTSQIGLEWALSLQ